MSPIEKIIWWALIAMMLLHGIRIAEAGTNFQQLSDTLEIWVFVNGVLIRAKESNQKFMSKDRIREIYEQAMEVKRRNQGAMVFTSSTIIKDEKCHLK